MPFFVFLCWLLILGYEGFLLATVILKKNSDVTIRLPLALPLAAFTNVLIVFLCTVLGISLLWWTLLVAHVLLIAVLFILKRRQILPAGIISSPVQPLPSPRTSVVIFRTVCFVLLAVQIFFSFSHAVILPTYHIDSLSNWTMRSKVSFYDHAIAFDPTEVRGVAKPQYPFLFHALQITVNEGNTDWNDRSANSILFFLTLSSFTALFFIIKQKKGFDSALIGIALLTGIPLLTFHLTQGYGDLTLISFLCLSFVSLWMYRSERDARWLLLSAVLTAAGVWTKSEGLIVGFFPWILLLLTDIRIPERRRAMKYPVIPGTALSLLWPAFLLTQGMGLTPHSSDTRLEWHSDALILALKGLFTSGSMGVMWFVIFFGSLIILRLRQRNDERLDYSAFVLGLWGHLSLLIILFTYVCTPNAVFLANGESYFRQLMIPASLFVLWGVIIFKRK